MAPSRAVSLLLSILSILFLATSSFAAAPDRITGPIVSGQTIRLALGVPAQTRLASDQGPVESSMNMNSLTLLTVPSPAQKRALTKLLADQQNPHSASYHKWLTPIQYADRFGLSPNDIKKMTNWLQSQGFTVTSVARARNWIRFSGTAAQVERAFDTQIHSFAANGETHFANTAPISIPSALSGIVTAVRGLNNFPAKSNAVRGKPEYTTAGGNLLLAPGDIATIYDFGTLISNGIDGTGITLAVIGETDVYLNDLNDFRNGFTLNNAIGNCTTNSNNTIKSCGAGNFQYVYADSDSGTDPGAVDTLSDDLPEADLDLEWSNAAARNATIAYVNAPLSGVFTSLYTAIDNADTIGESVITMSYTTYCEYYELGYYDSDEGELQFANSEGITFLNSSGDEGAAECDAYVLTGTTTAISGYAVAYPASSQYATAVGGTSIPVIAPDEFTQTYWNSSNGAFGASAKTYIPEQAWNDSEEFGLYCPTLSGHSCDIQGVTVNSWSTAQSAIGISAGGGGESNCVTADGNGVCNGGFPRPSWQDGISEASINPNGYGVISATTKVRLTPDVSLLSSPSFPGYIVCTPNNEIGGSGSQSSCSGGIAGALTGCATGAFPCSVFGGTSVASPVFAGIVALLNQYLITNGVQNTPGLQNINPTLYTLAASNSVNHAFNPVTTPNTGAYSNGAWCDPGTPTSGIQGDPWPAALQCPTSGPTAGFLGFNTDNFDTATNYNLVTGLGSVDVGNLFAAWAGTALSPTTTALTSAPNPSNLGQSVTFTATVTTSGTSTPTGTVTFKNGTTTIGTGTLGCVCDGVINSATTSISTSTLPAGTLSITAVYNGDSNNAGSTSSALSQVVNEQDFQFSGTVTDPPQAQPGQTTTTSMTLQAVGSSTFLDTVTYSCSSGLPTGATCSFNPTSGSIVSGTTSPQTVAITVNTAGPFVGAAGGVVRNGRRRAENQKPQLWLPLTLPLAGIFFVGFAGRNMRRRYQIAGLCVMVVFAGFLVACGGGGSSAAPVAVSVSPNPLNTLWPNLQGAPLQAQQFTATVTGTSNTAVTWAISSGGTTDTIASDGIYTAPTTTPPTAVVVTATSQADPTKTGSATVNIKTPTPSGNSTITVTVTEGSGGSAKQHTTSFTLSVQ
jgi:subtilase family serine protease